MSTDYDMCTYINIPEATVEYDMSCVSYVLTHAHCYHFQFVEKAVFEFCCFVHTHNNQ